MNFIEYIILGIIILVCLFYVIYYITKFFKIENKNDVCDGCPCSGICHKK